MWDTYYDETGGQESMDQDATGCWSYSNDGTSMDGDQTQQPYLPMGTDAQGWSDVPSAYTTYDPATQQTDPYGQTSVDQTGYTAVPNEGFMYTADGQLLDQYGQLVVIGADANLYDSTGQLIPPDSQLSGAWMDEHGSWYAPNGQPLKIALAADPAQSLIFVQATEAQPLETQPNQGGMSDAQLNWQAAQLNAQTAQVNMQATQMNDQRLNEQIEYDTMKDWQDTQTKMLDAWARVNDPLRYP